MRPESDEVLGAVLRVLTDRPEIERLRVAGHIDNQGSRVFNLGLSDRRARAVVDWLVKRGIDRRRLTAEGHGPDRPIGPNDTPEGQQNNRRVEFHIVTRYGAPPVVCVPGDHRRGTPPGTLR